MPDGYTGARKAEIVNLPNAITFGRLCAVPVAIWLTLRGHLGAAFAVFALAGLSDAADGWLARRRGGTALGAMLDPLADKALLIGMLVTLAIMRVVPDWLAILVVFRDLVVVGGLLLLWQAAVPVRVRPLMISKLATALQIVLVALALVHRLLPGPESLTGWLTEQLLAGLIWATAACTLASGAAYIWIVARGRLR